MRDLLNILNETSLLTESRKDYESMINPVLDALGKPTGEGSKIAVDVNATLRDKIIKRWGEIVAEAMKTLKKADRVTWFLRAMRIGMVGSYAKHLDPVRTSKMVRDFEARSGTPFDQDHFPLMAALPELEHFLSLPIPEIANYQFRFQSWTEIHSTFVAAESRWKSTVENSFVDDDCKTIIDFKNGWFWVNTERASCDKESQAMGHCGNSPRSRSDDQLLSLRKKIMVGDQARWEPHLTFILARDGFLTEMKGRNNDKPVEKYHKMIVALLADPIIKGIRGGGYLPQNNFSMDDLDAGLRNKLIEEKPELGSTWNLYEKYGLTDAVFDRVCERLRTHGLEEPHEFDADTGTIVIFDGTLAKFAVGELDLDSDVVNLATGDRDEIEWLDTSPAEGLRIIEGLDEDPDTEHDIIGLIASLIHLDKDQAIDGLLHTFPKSVASIWDEVWEQVRTTAHDQLVSFVDNQSFDYRALMVTVTGDNVRVTVDAETLINDIASVIDKDENIDDDNNFEASVRSGLWFEKDSYGYDADPEEANEPKLDEYEAEAFRALSRHIRGLFDHSDQLEFGF
jgi:hypothetical protein